MDKKPQDWVIVIVEDDDGGTDPGYTYPDIMRRSQAEARGEKTILEIAHDGIDECHYELIFATFDYLEAQGVRIVHAVSSALLDTVHHYAINGE